jgi:DNA primase small subunit
MLEAVKAKIATLYDDFLASDFGFSEDRMRLVFSGGRGYHVHVFDERVWALGSHERREIVDWITGKGFDPTGAFKETAFDSKEFQGHVRVKKRVVMPTAMEAGWRGKIARGVVALAKTMDAMKPEDAIAFLAGFEGVTEEDAMALWKNLFKPRATKPARIRGIDRLVETGLIETLTDDSRDLLIRIVVQLQQVRLEEVRGVSLSGVSQRGETDEPVTSDIKRLIRMPSSLHGKTGLRVIALTRDDLEDFRPLRDAIPPTWTDEATRVRVRDKISLEMGDETFNVGPGQEEVPQYLAIFLAARGLATLVTEA